MEQIILGIINCIIYTLYFLKNQSDITIENIKVLGFFALLQLLYIYCSWYKREKSLLNGYIVFVTAFYAFNLGQPILELFNWVASERSLLDHYRMDIYLMYRATYVGMYFILFLHFGALWYLKKAVRIKSDFEDSSNAENKIYSIRKVAIYLCLISFPLYLYQIFANISIVLVYGYQALYDSNLNTVPKWMSLVGDFFEPSVIALYFSCQYQKRNIKIVTILAFWGILLPPFFLGGRSNAMIVFTIFLIVYSLFNKFNTRKILILSGILMIMFSSFAVIALTRGNSNKSLAAMESAYHSVDNPVASTISEMGFSMYPLCHCMDIFPEKQDFRYGDSYLYAMTSIIPNLGFWEEHPAKTHANLGEWLKNYLDLGFGPGFSLTAEAYVNFGYFGFIFFLIYGYYMAKGFRYINSNYIEANPFLLVVCLVFLWFSIKTVRNSFLGTVRAFFYYALPMYYMFVYHYKKHFKL